MGNNSVLSKSGIKRRKVRKNSGSIKYYPEDNKENPLKNKIIATDGNSSSGNLKPYNHENEPNLLGISSIYHYYYDYDELMQQIKLQHLVDSIG